MRLCAETAAQPEFSLCGDAFDAADDLQDEALRYRIAAPGERITCPVCLRMLADIFSRYTRTGKVKA